MNKKRINEFLENMEFMYNERISTKISLSNNEVYSWLVKLDNSDDHKKIDFNYWIDYFK